MRQIDQLGDMRVARVGDIYTTFAQVGNYRNDALGYCWKNTRPLCYKLIPILYTTTRSQNNTHHGRQDIIPSHADRSPSHHTNPAPDQ